MGGVWVWVSLCMWGEWVRGRVGAWVWVWGGGCRGGCVHVVWYVGVSVGRGGGVYMLGCALKSNEHLIPTIVFPVQVLTSSQDF